MDMAIQHSVQQLTKLQEQAAPSTVEQVSPQDAAAFEKMTQAAPEAATAASPAATGNTAARPAPVASTEAAASPGDKILHSLERLGTDMNDSKTRIMEQAGTSTAGKMCQLQFEVAQFSTNQAILGQSGSKSSQGVQTLLKGQ